MQWRLSYTQKCIICMFEGGINSAAALFSESTSSQVKLVFTPFFREQSLGATGADCIFTPPHICYTFIGAL